MLTLVFALAAAVLSADHAFITAIGAGNTSGAAAFLDQDFTWTDADGRTLDAAHVKQALPALLIAQSADRGPAGSAPQRVGSAAQTAGSAPRVNEYDYGSVNVIEIDGGKLHTLRVWVKRPAGWRLLVVQDVRSLDAPPTSTPGTGKTCENPCGAVPYTPKNATERGVMAAYSELEAAATGGKADAWKMRAADEIALVSSNSDRTFDKPTRAAAIAKATLGGVAPTKLLSARLFDFDNAVVMTSQHETDKGQRLHITRVWVNRDGRWQETLSYQTAIR